MCIIFIISGLVHQECCQNYLLYCPLSCHKTSKDIKLVNFNLPKAELDALRSLFRNKEPINEKTHKGNTVLLLNTTDFISKMQMILPDI